MIITQDIMLVHTEDEQFPFSDIDNRRFMYCPKTKELILGRQYALGELHSSHSVEHGEAGTSTPFDQFVRGWVGTGGEYPHGVIHFAPHIDGAIPERFDAGFSTLIMFWDNGAKGETVVRGFGKIWERELCEILCL